MKKTLLAVFAFSCISTAALFAQESKIIGSWVIQEEPTAGLTFNKNKTMEINEHGHSLKGTWSYDAATKQISLTSPEEEDVLVLQLIEVSKAGITLQEISRGSERDPFHLVRADAKNGGKSGASNAKNMSVTGTKALSILTGEWQICAISQGGIVPAAERSKMGLSLQKDGNGFLMEHDDKESINWSVSTDGKNFLMGTTGGPETYTLTIFNKNLFAFSMGNYAAFVFQRVGSPEPKNLEETFATIAANATDMNHNNNKKPEEVAKQHPRHAQMVGTWQVVQIGMDDTQTEEILITFEKDGKLITNSAADGTKNGKWKMTEDGGAIQISEDYGYDYYGASIIVQEVTTDTIRLMDNNQEMVLKRHK